jgi:hypothetical protein
MAVANPPPLVPIAARSGGQISAQPAPLDSPESGHLGIIPIVLFLIIAAPQGFNFVPFSGSLQYGKATRLQADDGSDRGPARGLFRWAKASVGSGDRRRRASSAARPFSEHEFWCFGPDKGPSIVFGQATRAAGAAAARVVGGVFCGARHARSKYLTHARALS